MKKLIMNVSLVLGCLATVSPAFALSPPLDECQVDADCGQQERCVQTEQTCVEWPEPGSEVCFTQKVCEADSTTTSCHFDADCAPEQFCNQLGPLCTPCAFIDEDGDGENDVECPPCDLDQGVCEDRPTTAPCASDADCGSGERCEQISECASCPFIDEDGDGSSDYPCPPCTDTTFCVADPQPNECSSDADCREDQDCVLEEVDCPACPFIDEDGDGMSDINCSPCAPPVGRCQDDQPVGECTQDADCRDGQRCELATFLPECPVDGSEDGDDDGTGPAHCGYVTEGYCVNDPQPSTCDDDADCGDNMVCVNDTICPPCASADPDGDGQDDFACDLGCEERSYCAPREPVAERTCSSDADCSADSECVLEENGPVCDTGCEVVDGDGDGDQERCVSNCAPVGQCQLREARLCGTDEQPVPMPHEEDDTSVGELLGCQSTQQKSAPTTLSLLALGLFGLVASRRRRRRQA